MKNITGPVVIISPPRSRADLFLRMIQASGVAAANADGLVSKLSTLGDPDSPLWKDVILANLRAAAGVSAGTNAFVLVDRLAGHTGWQTAKRQWTWLLDVVPDLKIIFLSRSHTRTLASMECGGWKVWIPRYGNCASSCEKNLANHLDAISRFSELRPDRSSRVNSDELLSFTRKPEWITEDAWTNEILNKTHTVDTLVAPAVHPDWQDWDTVKPLKVERNENASAKGPVAPPEAKVYMLTVDEAPRAKSMEVHTLRFGQADWLDACVPALEEWCGRHEYPLKVHGKIDGLPDEKFGTVAMIREFLSGDADMMLFVDADVFPHPMAPAFPLLQGFSAYVETFGRVLRDWANWDGAQETRGWKYRNSGVWTCDRASAALFLAETELSEEWKTGYREQHQFNLWWSRAVANGMVMSDLPIEWNRLSKVAKNEVAPAWFFHLNGPKKLKTLSMLRGQRMLPPPPRAFTPDEPTGIPRAICYPWLASSAVWEELRFSLRSVLEHFTDRKCPVFILGPERPEWLLDDERVRFIEIDYSQGNRAGMAAATRKGMQIAEEILWMNDDIYFIKKCGWDDFKIAVTEGSVDERIPNLLASRNGWQMSMAHAAIDLHHHGVGEVMKFATHTPYYYERRKCLEIFQKFRLPYKGAWETLYHGYHRTPHRPIGRMRVNSLCPRRIKPETLVLNHNNKTLTRDLKISIEKRFPEMAPWESAPPMPTHVTPYFGKGAVVWPYKEDEEEYGELWYSWQSVKKHFSEKDWTHVLCGDVKPDWWEGEFVHAPSYASAVFAGTQCADEVLWMNDDIFMIADQTPGHFELAREGKEFSADELTASENGWDQMLGGVMMTLDARGLASRNFETHIPYLFRRDKVKAAFEVFAPRYKMPFATVYHNLHASPFVKLTEKARNPDEMVGKLWINPQSRQVTSEFMEELVRRFGSPPVAVL